MEASAPHRAVHANHHRARSARAHASTASTGSCRPRVFGLASSEGARGACLCWQLARTCEGREHFHSGLRRSCTSRGGVVGERAEGAGRRRRVNAVGGEHGRPGAGIQRGLAARRQQERARRSRRRRGARVHDAGSLRVRGATPLCTRPHCKTGCSAATLPRPMPVRRPAGSRLTGPPHRRRRGSRALAVAAARFPVSPNPPPLDRSRPRTARPPSRWRRRRAPRATHPSRGSCQKPRPSPYRRRVCCTYPLAGCAWSAAPHERGGRGGGAEGEGGRPSVPAGRGRRCAGAAAPLSILPQRGGAPLPRRLSGARVRGRSASAPPRARGGRGVGSACAAAAAARLAPPPRQRRAAAIVPAARRRPIGWRRRAPAVSYQRQHPGRSKACPCPAYTMEKRARRGGGARRAGGGVRRRGY